MSFLSPSIIFGRSTRRNVFRWLHTGRVCMAGAYAVFLAKQAAEVAPTLSFENLGLGTTFIKSLRKAFPQVKNPTDTQAQLIPAVLGTRDIILKDVNGSGKSFGMMLGLMNKSRLVSKEWKNGKEIEKHHITTVLLVHHRDLAFQLYRIVHRITSSLPKTNVESIAYVLVRGTGIPMDRQLIRLQETPPHILICTPKALLDIYRQRSNSLNLSSLSTIAVDDTDYLIEPSPRKDSKKKANDKAKQKVGLTRQFLNGIYRTRFPEQTERMVEGKQGPQLILLSGGQRVQPTNYFEESRWLDKDNLITIFKDDEREKMKKKKVQNAGHPGVTGKVLHRVLVVSGGETKKIAGAGAEMTKDDDESDQELEALR